MYLPPLIMMVVLEVVEIIIHLQVVLQQVQLKVMQVVQVVLQKVLLMLVEEVEVLVLLE